jgi:ectoine hydroxylase-related dioxygenase (phytanoyl-CoA dioxygenase family)
MHQPQVESRIREQGFANIGAVIDAATIATMREQLERAIHADIERWSTNPWYRDSWMVHNLMLRHPVFMAFLENQAMHDYLSRLLPPSPIVYAFTSSSLPANGSNYSRRIHVDAQSESTDYVTNVGVLVALDDFTEENGATYFLPGSHLSLEVPGEEAFFSKAVRALPRAGEAIVFNARTFHYGGLNTTDRARHAITLNVCRNWMKQRFDYPRMLSEEQIASLGPVGRRFIGMDSRIPASLEEYYVAPEDRLFKTAQAG